MESHKTSLPIPFHMIKIPIPILWDRRGLRHLVNVVLSYLSFGQVMAMLVK